MAIITAVRKSPFDEKFQKRAKAASRGNGSIASLRDFSHVRRPFRGIVIKEDTFATIEVFESDGTPVPLFNAGAREPIDQIAALYREKGFVNLQTDTSRSTRPDSTTNTDRTTVVANR